MTKNIFIIFMVMLFIAIIGITFICTNVMSGLEKKDYLDLFLISSFCSLIGLFIGNIIICIVNFNNIIINDYIGVFINFIFSLNTFLLFILISKIMYNI